MVLGISTSIGGPVTFSSTNSLQLQQKEGKFANHKNLLITSALEFSCLAVNKMRQDLNKFWESLGW